MARAIEYSAGDFGKELDALMSRDNITEEYAKNRIAAQHDNRWFQENCDYCLENNGTAEDFQKKSIVLLTQLGIIKENKS